MEKTKKFLKKLKKFIFENYTDKIAIRSSNIDEDGNLESFAGKYLSLLNIDTNNDKEIIKSVNKVIKAIIKTNTPFKIRGDSSK